jgi:hypothetical protein
MTPRPQEPITDSPQLLLTPFGKNARVIQYTGMDSIIDFTNIIFLPWTTINYTKHLASFPPLQSTIPSPSYHNHLALEKNLNTSIPLETQPVDKETI